MRAVAIVCMGALALTACQKKTDEAAKTGEETQAAANAPATAPAGPPRRKPGLWVQTINAAGMTQETKICLDDAVEKKMTLWGQGMSQEACARNEITPTAGGWKVESECDFGEAGKSVTSGTVTGDFSSKYVMKMTSTTTGAKSPQANGTQTMEMTGAWQGACPADMKPGDMLLPSGMKMNIANLPGAK